MTSAVLDSKMQAHTPSCGDDGNHGESRWDYSSGNDGNIVV